MKKIVYLIIILTLAALYYSCSSDDKKSPVSPDPTILNVFVMDIADSTAIEGANVVLFDAETNQSVARELSDEDGKTSFHTASGTYYVEISAQSYNSSPAPNVTAVPFTVAGSTTTVQNRYLTSSYVDDSGYITGYISPATANFLVIADSGTETYTTVSGPDGFFVIYNLPYATYSFNAYKAGYKHDSTEPASVTLSNNSHHAELTVNVSVYQGSSFSGQIGFRAGALEKVTDMALRERNSNRVIPGLTTLAEQAEGLWIYSFENIPDGDYEIWASFRNDSNVVDPHQVLIEDPERLFVSFPADDGTEKEKIFLVNSILIEGPTNTPEVIIPVSIDTLTPEFSWTIHESYNQRKEWFIEVRDINGDRIWGGFNSDGTVNHDVIGPETLSVVFNFDGRAAEELKDGGIYQWQIWADHGMPGTLGHVDKLLSSSEDLMGLFRVVLPAEGEGDK